MESIVTITKDNYSKYREYLQMKQKLSKMNTNAIMAIPILGALALLGNIAGIAMFATKITLPLVVSDIFIFIPLMEISVFGITSINLRVHQLMHKKRFIKKYPDINMDLNELYVEKLLIEYEKINRIDRSTRRINRPDIDKYNRERDLTKEKQFLEEIRTSLTNEQDSIKAKNSSSNPSVYQKKLGTKK